MVCLKGDASTWYYYEESCQTFMGLPEFKKLLWECFCSSQMGNMMATTSSLADILHGEYLHDFELLFALFLDLPKVVLENAFVNGLQEEVKTELRIWEPKGLGQGMKMAQMLEDKKCASSQS